MSDDLVWQGINAIKKGDKATARRALSEALTQNPRNETAWLWLFYAVDDIAQKRECLQRALKINPSNQQTRQQLEAIDALERPVSAPQRVQQTPIPYYTQAPPQKRGSLVPILLLAILVACGIFCVIASLRQGGDSGPTPRDANMMCEDFVKNRLVAPATAKFPSLQDVTVIVVSDTQNIYKVSGYVDSQNRMGALVRTHYTCVVKYIGNNKWQLQDLEILDY